MANFEGLLRGGVSQSRVASLVRERGISFEMSSTVRTKLASYRLTDDLLKALEKAGSEYRIIAEEETRKTIEKRKIDEQNPKAFQDHVVLSQFFRERGEYAAARAELEKAKALVPSSAQIQLELDKVRKACIAEKQVLGQSNLEC